MPDSDEDRPIAALIADLYGQAGGVLVGRGDRPLIGIGLAEQLRKRGVSDIHAEAAGNASADDVNRAKALFFVRMQHRDRVESLQVAQVPEERLRILDLIKRGQCDSAFQPDMNLNDQRALLKMSVVADVWFLPEDTCRLLDHAIITMPSWVLSIDDLPDTYGLVMFATPVESPSVETDVDVPYTVHAVCWGLNEVHGEQWVQFRDWAAFLPPGEQQTRWEMFGSYSWAVGADVDDRSHIAVRSDNDPDSFHDQSATARRRMACLWSLAMTPRVLDRTDQPVDRATRRRGERFGVISKVVLVDVRRPESNEPSGDASDVAWTHQWMVSGHWRKQPYGPGRQQTRPVWISPHVKGPADKPLVIKDKVKIIKPDAK